jgi:hypothetical protein
MQVRQLLQSLQLPAQAIRTTAGQHFLWKHPQIATAFARAVRSHTVHTHRGGKFVLSEKRYVDGQALVEVRPSRTRYTGCTA